MNNNSLCSFTLACFGKPPGALTAGGAVATCQVRGDAAEAAGLGDGRPRDEAVGAVRAVSTAPGSRLTVWWLGLCLRAALPAGV